MANIIITRDSGTTVLNTLAPDGSVQKSWNITTGTPTVDHVMAESKMLEMHFSIAGDYLGDDLNNKNICFTPALFSYLAIFIPRPGYKFNNRFEFLVSDYTDTTEYDMTLVVQSGYAPDIAQNWRCTFEAVDENDFIIRFYYYQMQDDHDWMGPVGRVNHNKLFRSSKNDVVDLPTYPYATSVYSADTQRLSYYLFIEDVTDPMNTKGYKIEKFKYEAGWYGFEEQVGAPFFTNPIFTIYRDSLPVTGLSPAYPTQVRFRVTAPNAFSFVTEAYLWMVKGNSTNDSVNFKDNYKASFAKLVTDGGVGVIDNMLIKPETGPTNDIGNEYFVDCFIDPAQLIYGETYRFIGIAYMKDGDIYQVNSFISQGFRVDAFPQFNGDGFTITGTLKDYNKEFEGNELICVIEERIQSKLVIDFPADQYKNDILARLGLVCSNDIRTYMNQIVLELYDETDDGFGNITKQIYDRKIFVQTSPTTYTSNNGATLTFNPTNAQFTYDFRNRFEDDIPNVETQYNGVPLTSPTSNQDWAGKTILIEWKLIFNYFDYVTPFEESVRFIQKIKPKDYEVGTKLQIFDENAKVTPAFFCSDDPVCFEALLNVSGAEGEEDEYRLITTIEKTTENISNIEENEEWIGDELMQLDSPKFINQESAFSESETNKAKFCVDPSLLIFGQPYKVCAIAKRLIPEFISPSAKAYYDALFSANGDTDIDSDTLYGVSLINFKSAIDTLFIQLESDGILSKLLRFTPRLGGTLATNGINAVNPGTYDGSFLGAPSVVTNGLSYDGIDDAEDTNFSQSNFDSYINLGASFKMPSNSLASGKGIIGVNDSGTFTLIYTIATYFYNFMGAPSFVDFYSYSNGFWSWSKISASVKTYLDGALIQTGTQGGLNGMGVKNLHIAAYNADGTIQDFAQVVLRNESLHDGLTDTETMNFYNALSTFDTEINRI